MNRKALATKATRQASILRIDSGIRPDSALCPIDLALSKGFSVRFVDSNSLEGIYSPSPSLAILIGANRPPGRRNFTCGHELGHHVFGHGFSLDSQVDEASAPSEENEFIAQRFSAGLLMPRIAVEAAFFRRGWNVCAPSPQELFVVSQSLSVSYGALLIHLEVSLQLIRSSVAEKLRDLPLHIVRSELAGFDIDHDLIPVDLHWNGRSIDLEVGDVGLLPSTATFRGKCAKMVMHPRKHLIASAPGLGVVKLDRQSLPIAVRVSKRNFSGLAQYRHLDPASDD